MNKMGIINRVIKFFWYVEKPNPTQIMSDEASQLRITLHNFEKSLARIERKVYRDIAKGDGNYDEESESWLKEVKNG